MSRSSTPRRPSARGRRESRESLVATQPWHAVDNGNAGIMAALARTLVAALALVFVYMVLSRTPSPGHTIRCPKGRDLNFMELPEEKQLADIFSGTAVQPIILLRGASDSGKTTALQQTICDVGAAQEALYIEMRGGLTSNVVSSFEDLCTAFEEALLHHNVPPPPPDSRGMQRFRHILSNMKEYQDHTPGHRIVVIDYLQAVQYMGQHEVDIAIKLIMESMIWIQKSGGRVVVTSSDDVFLDRLLDVYGHRLSQRAMGNVPISECMKHAKEPKHRALLEAALSRTGTSMKTCVAVQGNSVEAAEERLVADAWSLIERNPSVCHYIANPPHTFATSEWRPLRKVNVAEKMVNGAKMLDIYIHPAVKTWCAELGR